MLKKKLILKEIWNASMWIFKILIVVLLFLQLLSCPHYSSNNFGLPYIEGEIVRIEIKTGGYSWIRQKVPGVWIVHFADGRIENFIQNPEMRGEISEGRMRIYYKNGRHNNSNGIKEKIIQSAVPLE